MPEAPILEVSGVTTFYGTIQALHGVDLDEGAEVGHLYRDGSTIATTAASVGTPRV